MTTLRPDFRAPVARRVVGLRSQFRVEALVWPLSEGIRTRHCHLRHRVSPTEPGDRCESASLDIHTEGGDNVKRRAGGLLLQPEKRGFLPASRYCYT